MDLNDAVRYIAAKHNFGGRLEDTEKIDNEFLETEPETFSNSMVDNFEYDEEIEVKQKRKREIICGYLCYTSDSKEGSIMAKAKVKKKKDKTIRNLLIFVVLFLIILVATVFNDILIIKSNKEETKEYSELYENLLEEEASLNSEVIKLQDPDYIARYAREKFMYTKDGELILKIVDGEILTNEELGKDSKEDKGEE